MDANRTSPAYTLKDELARLCLPTTSREPERKLAWVNSICLLVLIIGLMGARRAPGFVAPPPPAAQVVPTVIEPLPPPPAATENQKPEQPDQNQPAPRVVAVTLNSPAIDFAVPTVGNLVVPEALAQAPPAVRLKPLAIRINSTGAGGQRPEPPYPQIALEEAEQGSVTLSITANASGAVTDVQVKESSGYPLLDHSALDFIKRRWILPPGQGTRIYEATITYKLTLN
ncbi:MAG: TonB family protein [Verrucomicrobiia bacterium]